MGSDVEWLHRMQRLLEPVHARRARMLGQAMLGTVTWILEEERTEDLPDALVPRMVRLIAGEAGEAALLHEDLQLIRRAAITYSPGLLAASYLIEAALEAPSLDSTVPVEARRGALLKLADASVMALFEVLFGLHDDRAPEARWSDPVVRGHDHVLTGLCRIAQDADINDETAAQLFLEVSEGWGDQLRTTLRQRLI